MNDPQLWLVLAAVGLAVAFLWRRHVRVRRGMAPVCGNCDNCSCGEGQPH